MAIDKQNFEPLFKTVVTQQLDAMFRVAFRMLRDRDEAEDAVQEALDKAWRNLSKLVPDTQMKPWLFRILSNTCIDHLRVRHRRDDVPFDPDSHSVHAGQYLPDDQLINSELGRLIDAEIGRLSPSHQAVIQLVIVEQFSYEETALALGLPINTVRSRLSRARSNLRSNLDDTLGGTDGRQDDNQTNPPLRLVK